MSKSKRLRCVAITNNATKCKRYAIFGQVYCIHHQRQLADCADVGQQAAVNFDKEEQGPGLIEELWALIADDFTVLELRPLLLTCKTLFRLYTSEKWYQSHTRYLWIKQQKSKPFTNTFQDTTSKKIVYARKDRGYRLTIELSDDNFSLAPALFVVNSYVAAREIYRSIVKRGKKKVCTIAFDKSAFELRPTISRLIIVDVVTDLGTRWTYQVRRSFCQAQPHTIDLKSGFMREILGSSDDVTVGKVLIKLVADYVVGKLKFFFPAISYNLSEEAVQFKQ